MKRLSRHLIERHPRRLTGLAVLQLCCIEDTVVEPERALEQLSLDGLNDLARYDDRALSDPAFDLLWMELDQQAATVLIHPAAPVPTYGVTPAPVTDYPLETARITSDLLRRGVPKRFPQIRFVFRMRAVGSRRSPSGLPSHAACSRTIPRKRWSCGRQPIASRAT